MAERVGYWYWVGKLALAKGDVRRVRFGLSDLSPRGTRVDGCVKGPGVLEECI